MNKDYYDTLCLKRQATQQQIAESYKKLALRWHPKNAKQTHETAYYHFSDVSEAYEVLSDPVKRSFYDKYGWEKLKQGLYGDGLLKGGYRFGNNPDEIFQKFFHSNSEFSKVFDKDIQNSNSLFSHAFGGLNFKDGEVIQNLIIKVPCTLSQLYKGIAKNVSFQRKVLNNDGRSLSLRDQSRLLEIKPGFGQGTVLRFKEEGHESIQKRKSHLIFQIEEIPEECYSRNNENLIYTVRIPLAEALQCKPVFLTTLDNRSLRVGLDEIPSPNNLKQVENEGMPIVDSNRKGNLYIKFNIIFPVSLAQNVKSELRTLLK